MAIERQIHEREGGTLLPDGTLLLDCLCGYTCTITAPEDGDEYGALEAAQAEHAGILAAQLHARDLDTALRTAAELWASSDTEYISQDMSERQIEVMDFLVALCHDGWED